MAAWGLGSPGSAAGLPIANVHEAQPINRQLQAVLKVSHAAVRLPCGQIGVRGRMERDLDPVGRALGGGCCAGQQLDAAYEEVERVPAQKLNPGAYEAVHSGGKG